MDTVTKPYTFQLRIRVWATNVEAAKKKLANMMTCSGEIRGVISLREIIRLKEEK